MDKRLFWFVIINLNMNVTGNYHMNIVQIYIHIRFIYFQELSP